MPEGFQGEVEGWPGALRMGLLFMGDHAMTHSLSLLIYLFFIYFEFYVLFIYLIAVCIVFVYV